VHAVEEPKRVLAVQFKRSSSAFPAGLFLLRLNSGGRIWREKAGKEGDLNKSKWRGVN